MFGRTRREIGPQTPNANSDVFTRSLPFSGREIWGVRMEEVLRAPAAHGVSTIYM